MSVRRVLVVDDNPLARQAVRDLLAGEPGFVVVGEAEDGYKALELARELMPDLILMDITMPRCDGMLATSLIKREMPSVTVVILTVSDDAADLFEAIKHGAQGYLLKSLDPGAWLACLRSVVQGEALPRELARRILAEFGGGGAPAADLALTDREREVLRLVAGAKSNREIAEALHIAEVTVKKHIKNIMQKLHLKNRVELAIYGQRLVRATGPAPQAAPRRPGPGQNTSSG